MRAPQLLRRDLLRWLGSAALAAPLVGLGAGRRARAAGEATPPLFVTFEAGGAWDTSLVCDPRGNDGSAKPANVGYRPDQIKTFGGHRVAPQVPAVVDFFSTYHRNILAINGIDTSTIDHASGARSSMSGIGGVGYPVTSALVGAVLGDSLPAPFMSNGGANDTADVVGMTQLAAGIAQALLQPMSGGNIHSDTTWTRLQAAMNARLQREAARAVAQRRADTLNLLRGALGGADALSALADTVRQLDAQVPRSNPSLPSFGEVDGDAALNMQVGLAGYLHGQSVALQLVLYGFDTHSNNDQYQGPALTQLFGQVDYLLRAAASLGISDRLLVFIASDFARTPYYNADSMGKDHWPTTSALLIDPGARPSIPVDVVVGASDGDANAVKLNVKTLKPDDGGVAIAPGHVHDALRRRMGIDQNRLCQLYSLQMAEQLPLLG